MSLDTLIPGVAPADLAAWISGVAAFVVVLLVWNAFVERDPLSGRLKALEARRAALKGDLSRTVRRTDRPAGRIGLMHSVVERFKLYGSSTAAKAAGKLALAGYRSKDSLTVYLFAKAILPFVGLGAAALLVFGMKALPLQGMQAAAACLGAGLFGSLLPDLYLNRLTEARQLAIRRALPDAFDLLVICAEAGLSLDAAFERVARELGEGCPELGEEIGLTSVELGFLPDRAKALQGLVDRVPLPGVRALVTTLAQTERYGTPLAQALRVLAAEMRNERMLKAEEKAARLPAIMTVPLMVFILPPLFVVLVGPAILKSIDQLFK
ncbi:type II secretion system F family protein [Azospirillum sp.]|uniref:type II secretion system F family protein n=1 Tax=Azospirillum sp. TaxID=34012 RepID=UPI003D761FFF